MMIRNPCLKQFAFTSALTLVVSWLGSSALAADANVIGTWKSSFTTSDGQTMQSSLKIKQAGDQLSGTVSGRNGNEFPMDEVKLTGDQLSLKVTRERNGEKITMRVVATANGDSLKGKLQSNWGGEDRTVDWVATRVTEAGTGNAMTFAPKARLKLPSSSPTKGMPVVPGFAAPLSWTTIERSTCLGTSRSETAESVVPQATPMVAPSVTRSEIIAPAIEATRSRRRSSLVGWETGTIVTDTPYIELSLDAVVAAGSWGACSVIRTSPSSRAEATRRDTVERDRPILFAMDSMVCCSM